MKKLMVAIIAITAGLAVNAATIKWNSGTVNNQAGTKANGTTALVTAYLYSLTAAQYSSASSMSADALYSAAKGGTYGSVVESKGTGSLGTANITQTVAGGSSDSPATYYGLVIYEDALTAGGPYVKAAVKTVTFEDDGQVSFSSLASGGSWTAATVPEPTSALLLVLGVAGLALRRKLK